MNNEVVTFKNEEFGSIREMTIDNEPWFVGKDVATALGYFNTRDALIRHVSSEDKNTIVISDGKRGNPNQVIINESGLYSLIISSKLPSAKKFKHWVTSEVLPAIRKNGGYIRNQENLSEKELLANAVLVAQKVIDEKNQKILSMTPKVEFYDTIMDTKGAISMAEAAKRLDMNIGRNNLFDLLRNLGVLDRHNLPYQKDVNSDYFRVVTKKYCTVYGDRFKSKTMVLPRGLDYIRKVLLDAGYSPAMHNRTN